MKRQSGASNTEYILIVVMIALAAIFMVKGLGVELRTLFSGATKRLNLFDGNAPDAGPGDPGVPAPSPTPPAPPPPGPTPPAPSPPEPDHNAECQQQLAALQAERSTRGAQLSQQLQTAQSNYHESMRRVRYWVPGHHSRWGLGGGGGHWSYRFIHSPSERRATRIALNRAQADYDNWHDDWQQRYQNWQADCGH